MKKFILFTLSMMLVVATSCSKFEPVYCVYNEMDTPFRVTCFEYNSNNECINQVNMLIDANDRECKTVTKEVEKIKLFFPEFSFEGQEGTGVWLSNICYIDHSQPQTAIFIENDTICQTNEP